MNPARAAAPGEGRSDLPETESAGAQEAGRSFAVRVGIASACRRGVEGMPLPATTESRKAGDLSTPMSFRKTLASAGFMDEKPWV
jgi:hypothetical protein